MFTEWSFREESEGSLLLHPLVRRRFQCLGSRSPIHDCDGDPLDRRRALVGLRASIALDQQLLRAHPAKRDLVRSACNVHGKPSSPVTFNIDVDAGRVAGGGATIVQVCPSHVLHVRRRYLNFIRVPAKATSACQERPQDDGRWALKPHCRTPRSPPNTAFSCERRIDYCSGNRLSSGSSYRSLNSRYTCDPSASENSTRRGWQTGAPSAAGGPGFGCTCDGERTQVSG